MADTPHDIDAETAATQVGLLTFGDDGKGIHRMPLASRPRGAPRDGPRSCVRHIALPLSVAAAASGRAWLTHYCHEHVGSGGWLVEDHVLIASELKSNAC